MISTSNLSMSFSGKKLFNDVSVKFTPGNCYGLIGANGAGKSTFVKILSGELSPSEGDVILDKKKTLAVLSQDHFANEEQVVMDVVMSGHEELYNVMKEQEKIYADPEATDDDYMKAGELGDRIEQLDGWSAETNAEKMLTGLGITSNLHRKLMKELTEPEKVKVLLAQAIFGEPDVLLLDEPTNGLDIKAIRWLENFLLNIEDTTVIVISHDRHFLNKVCTHIADIDFGEVKMYVGNYDFWYESNQLMQSLINNKNKKIEQKREELKAFITRFSANASKSKQATGRKKQLEALQLEDLQVSNRKYPFIEFKSERQAGNNLVKVENLCKSIEGVKILDNVTFTINTGDKVVFLAKNDIVKTTLMSILAGETEADSGEITWGVTTSRAYMPKNNAKFFESSEGDLIDWLRPYSPDQHDSFVRGFLGRMLFSGEDAGKSPKVLSGGEKVRCMLSKMMLAASNVVLFDNPTDHLDLESITSLNKALTKFDGTILFGAHDHEFIQTVATRIIEITPKGIIDKLNDYDAYLDDEATQEKLAEMYS